MAEGKAERVLLADAAVQLRTTPADVYHRATRGDLAGLARDESGRWTLPADVVKRAARAATRAAARKRGRSNG